MSADLADSLKRLAPQPRSPVDIEGIARRGRTLRTRRRMSRVAVTAALLLAVPVGWGALDMTRDDAGPPIDTPDQDHVPPPEYSPPAEGLWKGLDQGWTRLEAPPEVRARATSLWLGDSLFYWGGDTDSGAYTFNDGFIFRAKEREWERLPDAPLAARDGPASAWTGREVLIWGGAGPFQGAEALGDGAAYSPALQRWRRLPPAPIEGRAPAASVWTGNELIVFGDLDRDARRTDGAAYNPTTNSWRSMPEAPVALNAAQAVWTGDEVIVFGADLNNNNASRSSRYALGIAYSPLSDSWRTLPTAALSPQASGAVWVDSRMVVVDYEGRAQTYDPASNVWKDIADVPVDIGECYPRLLALQDRPFGWFCARGAFYSEAQQRWDPIPPVEGDRQSFGKPVVAGNAIALAGGAHEGTHNNFWVYKP